MNEGVSGGGRSPSMFFDYPKVSPTRALVLSRFAGSFQFVLVLGRIIGNVKLLDHLAREPARTGGCGPIRHACP
ncbi:MAG: hypothetical protein ACJAYH_001985 [Celeribacter sp.]|jgi:hypothetical protein